MFERMSRKRPGGGGRMFGFRSQVGRAVSGGSMVAVEAVTHTGRQTLKSEHPTDLSICSHDNASSDRNIK